MGQPFRGDCRLCGSYGVLRDSHVGAPSWAFDRVLKQGGTAQFVAFNGKVAFFSNDNRCEHLLCETCEQRFSVWENYVSTITVQAEGTFLALDSLTKHQADPNVMSAAALDCDAIVRFGASIFWRSSIGTRVVFALGSKFDDAFREYLASDTLPFPDDAALAGIDPAVDLGRVHRHPRRDEPPQRSNEGQLVSDLGPRVHALPRRRQAVPGAPSGRLQADGRHRRPGSSGPSRAADGHQRAERQDGEEEVAQAAPPYRRPHSSCIQECAQHPWTAADVGGPLGVQGRGSAAFFGAPGWIRTTDPRPEGRARANQLRVRSPAMRSPNASVYMHPPVLIPRHQISAFRVKNIVFT